MTSRRAGIEAMRPDLTLLDWADSALELWSAGAALSYMQHQGLATETVMRTLMLSQRLRNAAVPAAGNAPVSDAQHEESALDDALAASFPASDPVAITITRCP
ncbi:hypothetical protein ACLB1G_08285 [Oxalobacteraceae bacterium A2-2]